MQKLRSTWNRKFFGVKAFTISENSSWNNRGVLTTCNITKCHSEMVPVVRRRSHRLNEFWKASTSSNGKYIKHGAAGARRYSQQSQSEFRTHSTGAQRTFRWETIFQKWPNSDSCSKLSLGPRSNSISSGHRTISATFQKICAATKRYHFVL